MNAKTARITTLLEKFVREDLTPDEQKELEEWAAESENNESLLKQLTNRGSLLERLQDYGKANSTSMWQKTMQKINPGATIIEFPRSKSAWLRTAVAAAVIVLFSAGVLIYIMSRDASDKTAKTETPTDPLVPAIYKVVPGSNKASLTLADGSAIQLEEAPDGKLTQQGLMQVSKTGGHLSYTGRFVFNDRVSTRSAEYDSLLNMVSTPRGGQYAITLPDGSKVWLNAASSLRFPLAFAGKQRTVELAGEAYFEVAPLYVPSAAGKKSKVPFVVKMVSPDGQQELGEIEVLGTHFNVTAYQEDKTIKTTLVEGSVRVRKGTASRLLKPGQQAVTQNGKIRVQKVDVSDAVAWKNGKLTLSGTTEEIMNQIARWYNVEVEYPGKIPEKINKEGFEGSIPRDSDFKTVTKALKKFNIQIRLERNRMIVTS